MVDLSGKTALITGAGRGIGRAIAFELSMLGAHVVIMARSSTELEAVATEVRHAGGVATVIPGDLSETAAIEALVELVHELAGEPGILINNAATVAPLGASQTLQSAEVLRAINLNVVAPILLTSLLIPTMIDKAWGMVINVSSGIVAHPDSMIGGNVYAVSKSALEAHTINLAAELAGTGVTVNAYRPGTVDTQMQAWIREQDPAQIGQQLHDRFARSYAEGALMTPTQSARALISKLDSGATGQIWQASEAR